MRPPSEEEPFEIDDVEYGPASTDRSPVSDFRVGDRIGPRGQTCPVVKSEEDPSNPDRWLLAWTLPDGTVKDWDGAKGGGAKDWRWVQTTYIIREREELEL